MSRLGAPEAPARGGQRTGEGGKRGSGRRGQGGGAVCRVGLRVTECEQAQVWGAQRGGGEWVWR